MDEVLKKVMFTAGMISDCMLIITDAPKEEIEKWLFRYNNAVENGTYGKEVLLFDTLKTKYIIKELVDSELDMFAKEMCELIGYDEVYEVLDYIEEGDE